MIVIVERNGPFTPEQVSEGRLRSKPPGKGHSRSGAVDRSDAMLQIRRQSENDGVAKDRVTDFLKNLF